MGGPAIINDEQIIEEFDNLHICYFYEMENDEKLDYSSVEHYFQSHKPVEERSRRKVREARTTLEAYQLGNLYPLRKGWEEMKVEIMFRGNKLKFEQNDKLREKLIKTEGEIEFPESDSFWGSSKDLKGNKGSNTNGLILMALRSYFNKDLDTYSRYCCQLGIKPV